MNKICIYASLLILLLSGCTTPEIQIEKASALSQEKIEIMREQVQEDLQQYQMQQIRAGLPPLPIPLTEENIARIQSELKAHTEKPEVYVEAKTTPELQKMIHDSIVRGMQQAD